MTPITEQQPHSYEQRGDSALSGRRMRKQKVSAKVISSYCTHSNFKSQAYGARKVFSKQFAVNESG